MLLPLIKSQLKNEKNLSSEDIIKILNLIPESHYKGSAFKAKNGYTKLNTLEGQESEHIYGLNMIYLWESFFPELDVPEIDYLIVKEI